MPVYCSCTCYTSGLSRKDPMKQDLSILPSCHLTGCFPGTFFPQILGKWAKKKPKIGFFELKEKLVINSHRICSIIKIIIYCVSEQRLRKKPYPWDIGQNALSQSDRKIFKSTCSPDQIDEILSFLASNWQKLKIIENSLVGHWQK